jgi:heat-inducible transcriptional repressor
VTEAGNISTGFELNERAQNLLKILVERYIHDGQPVGSRTLSRDTGLDLSPATIRNVMADLEELGFLRAPHTSAGRVPTVRGYRFFVDSLLRVQTLDNQAIDELNRKLDASKDTTELMQSVSTMLSNFTRLAGVVMLPRRNVLTMRHVEFLLLSENRVLVILVVNEQEVQNRIIHTQRNYKQSELQQAANFLNEQVAGHDIQQVRKEVLRRREADRASRDDMRTTGGEMAEMGGGAEV